MFGCTQVPFFPKYETKNLESHAEIRVTFLEPKFSQSHYNYENTSKSSNACTLIVVLMACYCKNEQMDKASSPLSAHIIYLLAYSMLDGNKIHEDVKDKVSLHSFNLTVPEALEFAGFRAHGLTEWKSMIYMESLYLTLYSNIKANLNEWGKCEGNPKWGSNFYIILVADNRSVLFILQNNTVTLIDSHQHSERKGALIAVTSMESLNMLCLWYSHVVKRSFHCDPGLYELSFLHFKHTT